MQTPIRKQSHILALVFVGLLLILIVIAFTSFALGAYLVFNKPVSNVVAETVTGNSQAIVIVHASGLNSSVSRTVWVDPQINTDSSGYPVSVNSSSGVVLGNAITNSQGGFSQNFTLSSLQLSKIANDGEQVHSVWVLGLNNNTPNGVQQVVPVTQDSEKNYTALTPVHHFIFFVTLLTFDIPISSNLGTVFLALWTIELLMFAMALNGPVRSVFGAIRDTSKVGLKGIFGNSMLAMLVVFPVVLWATVLLDFIQAAGGIQTGSLGVTDPMVLYYSLIFAPLREEIGFRVIPIGLVAFLLIIARGRIRDAVLSLWHPSKYLKKIDSPLDYKRHLYLMYIVIAISAFLFGLAHYVAGAGWGPGKIAEAAMAGVAFGFLYYMYGLPSAILIHWSFDYFLTTFQLAPDLQSLAIFSDLYTILLALLSSVVLITLLIRKLRKRQTLETYTLGAQLTS